jgi:hypothetical protein
VTSSTLELAPRFRVSLAPAAARVLLAAVVAVALGGATSLGQTFLPEEAASLANSVTGWTLPTVALVFVTARSFSEAAVTGAVSFVALTVGYAVVSTLRGFPFDPTAWAVVGVLAGPVIGAATFALRRSPMHAAVGGGLLAGVLIGEGVYGLTAIAATTSPVFWWAAITVGVALLVAVAALRLRDIRSTLVLASVAALTAGVFVVAYLALPSVFRLL